MVVLKRDEAPRSALQLEGTEARCDVVHGRRHRRRAHGARAGRVRRRHRLPPRRPDHRRAPPTARRSRPSRPTCAAPGCCSRRAAPTARRARRSWPHPTRPTGPTTRCPTARTSPCSRATPTTRPRPRPTSSPARTGTRTGCPVAITRFANLYGGGDANTLAAHPRGGLGRAGRAPPGHPLGRQGRARLPLRRGRRAGLPGHRPRARRRRPRPRRGVQRRRRPAAVGARGGRARLRGRGHARSSPTSAARARRPGRSTASSSTRPSCASSRAGRRRSTSTRAGATVEWYRATPRRCSAPSWQASSRARCQSSPSRASQHQTTMNGWPGTPNGRGSSTRRRSSTRAAASSSRSSRARSRWPRKEGGGDTEGNPALALAVQKARDASMPKDNIERAIAKGTGEGADADALETVVYEGYGPGGVAMLVEAVTDNRNRTGSEVRHIFTKHGGNAGRARLGRLPLRQARRGRGRRRRATARTTSWPPSTRAR